MDRRSFFAHVAGALAAVGLLPRRAEAEAVTRPAMNVRENDPGRARLRACQRPKWGLSVEVPEGGDDERFLLSLGWERDGEFMFQKPNRDYVGRELEPPPASP